MDGAAQNSDPFKSPHDHGLLFSQSRLFSPTKQRFTGLLVGPGKQTRLGREKGTLKTTV
jgi:hypothetical protein